jgi:hypothetical protein
MSQREGPRNQSRNHNQTSTRTQQQPNKPATPQRDPPRCKIQVEVSTDARGSPQLTAIDVQGIRSGARPRPQEPKPNNPTQHPTQQRNTTTTRPNKQAKSPHRKVNRPCTSDTCKKILCRSIRSALSMAAGAPYPKRGATRWQGGSRPKPGFLPADLRAAKSLCRISHYLTEKEPNIDKVSL